MYTAQLNRKRSKEKPEGQSHMYITQQYVIFIRRTKKHEFSFVVHEFDFSFMI